MGPARRKAVRQVGVSLLQLYASLLPFWYLISSYCQDKGVHGSLFPGYPRPSNKYRGSWYIVNGREIHTEDVLNTPIIVLGLRLVVSSVVKNTSRPALPPKTRSTPGAFSYISTEANLLFEVVDVPGVISNQYPGIAQLKYEAVCCCWRGVLGDLTHVSDVPVK